MITQNAVANNYLTHQQILDKNSELTNAKTPAERKAIEEKYAVKDKEQQAKAQACFVDGNCYSVTQEAGLFNIKKELEAACAQGCDNDTRDSLSKLNTLFDEKGGLINQGEEATKFILESMAEIKVAGVVLKGSAALFARAYPNIAEKFAYVFTDAVKVEIPWGQGIGKQGAAWEDSLAAQLPADSRLPPGFKTFDFFDKETGLATSAKTLDTTTPAKIANPSQVYYSLKGNIDAAVNYETRTLSGAVVDVNEIITREVQVAVPANTTAAQWEQINRAIDYAKNKGVVLKVTKIK